MLLYLKSLVEVIKNKKMENMKQKAVGQVGENTLWDGPLSQASRPHAKGSSSGSKGMKLKLMQPCGCIGDCSCSLSAPITSRAKR